MLEVEYVWGIYVIRKEVANCCLPFAGFKGKKQTVPGLFKG